MKKKLAIVGLLAGSVVVLGALAYIFADGGGGGSSASAEKPASRKRSGPGAFGDAFVDVGADGSVAKVALSPEQEAVIRSALEKLGTETAIRNALSGGVAEPWPLPAAQQQFEKCVTLVQRGLAPESTVVPANVCACATRAIQQVYPREPPRPASGNALRIVRENVSTAIDECLNPQ